MGAHEDKQACGTCGGSGQIEITSDGDKGGGKQKITCSGCNGTGKA